MGTYFRGQLITNQFAGLKFRATRKPEILYTYTSVMSTLRQVHRGSHVIAKFLLGIGKGVFVESVYEGSMVYTGSIND